jgi:four helix bundle protein
MIKRFTDLEAWKQAHALTVSIYQLTKNFPKEEQFGITSQLRRCSSSVGANIAEGFSRYHYGDRLNFYYQARASLSEVQNFLLLAKDIKLVDDTHFQALFEVSAQVHKLLNGLTKKTAELRQHNISIS